MNSKHVACGYKNIVMRDLLAMASESKEQLL